MVGSHPTQPETRPRGLGLEDRIARSEGVLWEYARRGVAGLLRHVPLSVRHPLEAEHAPADLRDALERAERRRLAAWTALAEVDRVRRAQASASAGLNPCREHAPEARTACLDLLARQRAELDQVRLRLLDLEAGARQEVAGVRKALLAVQPIAAQARRSLLERAGNRLSALLDALAHTIARTLARVAGRTAS